jgi:Cu/Ag efflux protein CusF
MAALQRFAACLILVFFLHDCSQDTPIMVSGTVMKIDVAARKITINHEAIPNLAMPPMTMVFGVTDPNFLTIVKPGDRVRFSADHIDGQYVVTSIERAG